MNDEPLARARATLFVAKQYATDNNFASCFESICEALALVVGHLIARDAAAAYPPGDHTRADTPIVRTHGAPDAEVARPRYDSMAAAIAARAAEQARELNEAIEQGLGKEKERCREG